MDWATVGYNFVDFLAFVVLAVFHIRKPVPKKEDMKDGILAWIERNFVYIIFIMLFSPSFAGSLLDMFSDY